MTAKPSSITALNVHRTANLLIQQHRTFAKWTATQRAQTLMEFGDIRGYQTFLRVADAIAELERQRANAGELVN